MTLPGARNPILHEVLLLQGLDSTVVSIWLVKNSR